ncbi:hypothetical protein SDC9_131470 [bioreactor metagenome]|uniref:Uncharacterized protein n=1 Tax=bioreactor metagenome TaxID=1076179 RepID=A0A645D5A5_9ZZZZ
MNPKSGKKKLEEMFDKAGIPCGPVLNMKDSKIINKFFTKYGIKFRNGV